MRTGEPRQPMRAHGRHQGFTYLMLLWWVAIGGVMLMALAHSWRNASRREKEAELVFRGGQIKAAIEAYARVPVTQTRSRLPAEIDDLLEDRRSGRVTRHLRKLWPDPMTGGEWAIMRDDKGGITGVYSAAQGTPLRAPPGVAHYSEWRFEVAEGVTPMAASSADEAEHAPR